MDKIKSIFKSRQNLQELHVTSDNIPFFKDHDAKAHAAKLKDKSVKEITRSEVLGDESEDTENPVNETGVELKAISDMSLEEVEAEIKVLGYEDEIESEDEAREILGMLRAEKEQD